jgi:hypothetical protein
LKIEITRIVDDTITKFNLVLEFINNTVIRKSGEIPEKDL